jgi:hypothetical protein
MSGFGLLELCMLLAERKYHRGFCNGLEYDGASWSLVPPFRRKAPR